MSREYKRGDYNKVIRIKPEGWVDELVFELGEHQCGQARCGIYVHINDEAGGVLTLDDMAELCFVFSDHFNKLGDHAELAGKRGATPAKSTNLKGE